jgi:hypothetical protein
MTTFNELPIHSAGANGQIWLVGSTEAEVEHLINECYLKQLARSRMQFSPVMPMPTIPGKFMAVLIR